MHGLGLGLSGTASAAALHAQCRCSLPRLPLAQGQLVQVISRQPVGRRTCSKPVGHRIAWRQWTACAAAAEPSATETILVERPKVVTEAWQRILDMQKTGQIVTTTIDTVNRGGVIVKVEGIQGFIPMSRLDPSRFADQSVDVASSEDQAEVSLDDAKRSAMVGQTIKAKIIQVNVPERLLVLSERAAYMADLSRTLKRGDIVEGTVQKLTDYGAFVSITAADGNQHGTDALIHKSELSWDRIMRPEQVVRPGDVVQCKVASVDPEKARVTLSLKRMQSDPLKETLDGVLPLWEEGAEALGTVPTNVPQSIEEVASELEKEEGISGISMGRQVEERRTVAQDLEIYISRKKVEDGYALVARAGRVVQEVVVKTELDPAGLKAAMQRALKRLV